MPSPQIERKLAAIMFTDIVGYSQMVAKDEKTALELLDEHNNIIFPIIKNHNGVIIKLIGDAIFAKFLSIEDSILSAIKIQTKLRDRNNVSRKNEKIQIRVGLHSGLVIEKDDDLFGHDVNLCSRIESITQPGSITISEEIFKSVENIDDLYHRKIGYVKLKNIPTPKILYKTYLDLLEFNNDSESGLHNSFIDKGIEIVDIEKYEADKIISLGVSYFTNLGKESDEYYCYNFTKDLIDSLQSVDMLRVPSINEISKYKKQNYRLSDLGRKLQVDKLIQGSILVNDDMASVALEFIDINNGKSLWSKSLEIDLSKITHIHNQILEKILELLEIDIPDHLKKQFVIKSTDNPLADKEYKKARFLIDMQQKKEDLAEADKHLQTAIKNDPKFLFAHSQRGVIAFKLGEYERSEDLLNTALELAEGDGSKISNGYVYSILGQLYVLWFKNKKALQYNKKALEVWTHLEDPLTEATIMHNLATSYLRLGKPEDALQYYNKSLLIKQQYEDRLKQGYSYGQIGKVNLSLGNYSKAIYNLNRSLAIFKDFGQNFNLGISIIMITEAYIETGQIDVAEKLIGEAEIILDEYKDPTLTGRLYNYKGTIDFYKLNIGQAISNLENSIQQYQSSQKLKPAFQGQLLLAQVHTYNHKFGKAEIVISNIETVKKQIDDHKLLLCLASMKYLIDTLNNKTGKETGYKIIDNLSNNKENSDYHLTYWYLALAFSLHKDTKLAQKYLIKSQSLLKEKNENESDKKIREILLNTNPIVKQIIAQETDSFKEYTDSLLKINIKIEVSKFCPECGYSNIDLKPFCPECGNRLNI